MKYITKIHRVEAVKYDGLNKAEIDGRPYSEIVEIARDYIKGIGGFEKFAEWGLVR